MADMRPSWPPPMMPIGAVGRQAAGRRVGRQAGHEWVGESRPPLRSVAARRASRRMASVGVGGGEDGGGEQGGVDGAGAPDREGADGDAGGHLDDAEQAIHAFQGRALDGDAEDGQRGPCGAHAGEVGGAARAGDDDAEAAGLARPAWRSRRGGPACGGRRRCGPRGSPAGGRGSLRCACHGRSSRTGCPL